MNNKTKYIILGIGVCLSFALIMTALVNMQFLQLYSIASIIIGLIAIAFMFVAGCIA